ncbi:MAG TPA: dipeptidase [Gemmatimonadaceae bacterium]|nr:dipeptidase [Gemmatimonadaceae bacterium]
MQQAGLRSLATAAVAAVTLAWNAAGAQGGTDAALIARARAIHDRVITLDTHVDINPSNFTAARPNYTDTLNTQVNLPKMFEGGLDAAFFSIYVGQGPLTPEGYQRAYEVDMEKFAAVHRLAKELAPDKIEIAYRADDVAKIAAKGKKVALMGVENAYGVGTDITNIKKFYDQGARYMSLSHNGHSQFSDSNTGERDGWMHNGLSALGRQAVAEMNRLGIMIDVSHPSKQSMMQTLALTKAPIIASHSAVRALCNHSRNLDDEQLLALKKNGGVVQMVAFSSYVKTPPPPSPERQRAIAALRTEFGLPAAGGGGGGGGGRGGFQSLTPERRAEYQRRMAAVDSQFPPPPRATVKDFVDHIDYAVKLIGIDHVGISSDFDGGGGVEGWSDARETFNVTLELVRRGYTEEQIAKIWSGNTVRVMREVEKVAAAEARKAA